MSPFGATVSQRGCLKSAANTFKRNPAGTVGKKPAGGFARSGPLPAELVANGGGSLGFWPRVTCAGTTEDRQSVKIKTRMLRALITIPSQKTPRTNSFFMMPQADTRFHTPLSHSRLRAPWRVRISASLLSIQQAPIRIQSGIERVI